MALIRRAGGPRGGRHLAARTGLLLLALLAATAGWSESFAQTSSLAAASPCAGSPSPEALKGCLVARAKARANAAAAQREGRPRTPLPLPSLQGPGVGGHPRLIDPKVQ